MALSGKISLVISALGCGAVMLFSATAQASGGSGDFIVDWNEAALDTVRGERLGAAPASRVYALVNVAIYDAVNSIDKAKRKSSRPNAMINGMRARPAASRSAAAAAAAHTVLSELYPARAADYDALLAAHLAALGHRRSVNLGYEFGARMGSAVMDARAHDGVQTQDILPGGTNPGQFRADFTSAQYRNMAPFAVADPAIYVNPAVVSLTSREYAAAHTDVRMLGDARYANQDYDEIYRFWRGGGGTARPPGEWIKVAGVVAEQEHVIYDISQTARLYALLGMALADSTIVAWTDKFNNQFWRPTTAINNADSDSNADTAQDTEWTPRNGSIGGSPEYTSGQSTYAGAGSTILAAFFCNNNISFTFTGDNSIAGERTFNSFSEAAAEAGRARIFAGIHFEFSNQAGQRAGRAIAREISTKLTGKKPDCFAF